MFFQPNNSDILNGQRVLVIGFGRQGQALARWLPSVGAFVLVNDRREEADLGVDPADFPRVQFLLGGDLDTLPDGVSMVCISGGVPLEHPIVQEAQAKQIPVTNDAQLFVERSPAPIIGITGSAGKTTTTTLVGEMCKAAGWTTWVGGNIGNVLLDVMMGIQPAHQVVMELSSFQLEVMISSPTVGAVLNVTPNHLDRHGTMENYMRAKARILAFQKAGDRAILNNDDPGSKSMAQVVQGEPLWFSRYDIVTNGAFMVGQRIAVTGDASPDGDPKLLCDISDIKLRGEHNVSNVLAACAIAGASGVPPEAMTAAIKDFRGVPHRLEVVRELDGVTYINDSIATAPERVVAALRSFEEPVVLLAGGADKKLDWDEMVALALGKCRHIIAFGRDGDIVVDAVKRIAGSSDDVTRVATLDEAVAEAVNHAQPGDTVLLSPGGTSYDAYKDFAARGEHFRKLVNTL